MAVGGIHGLFVTGAGLGAMTAWRLNEDVRAETREAYRQARESEQRFKSAFENAPIGMVLSAPIARTSVSSSR